MCYFIFYSLSDTTYLAVGSSWEQQQFQQNTADVLKKQYPVFALLSSRADLLGLYEQVILTDIEFSDSQNVDQALWKNVFYQVIERFRQLLKDPSYDNTPHVRNLLLTLLDEVRNVYKIQIGKIIIILFSPGQTLMLE